MGRASRFTPSHTICCLLLVRHQNLSPLSEPHVLALNPLIRFTIPSADFCRFIAPPLDGSSPKANRQTSPGIAHSPSRFCPAHLRQDFPCRYWALKICASSPSLAPASDFCSSGHALPAASCGIPSRDGHTCRPANDSPCRLRMGLSPTSECALPGAHKLKDQSLIKIGL